MFGATVSAFATAVSAGTVDPSRSGVTVIFVLPIRSTTGRWNAVSTAWIATSGAIPPTVTPPTVTPSGTTAAGVVVVVVVVVVVSVGVVVVGGGVSASTDAARTPDASTASKNESEMAARLITRRSTVGRRIRGSSVMIPSIPLATRVFASTASFTVQA